MKLSLFNKTARVIIPVFMLVVICFLANSTVNQHFHKLTSGIVVKHAHPFEGENTGSPFQEHNHTSSELLLLEQISNTYFWIWLFIIFPLALPVVFKIIISPLIIFFKNPDRYFLRNYHAPPSPSY